MDNEQQKLNLYHLDKKKLTAKKWINLSITHDMSMLTWKIFGLHDKTLMHGACQQDTGIHAFNCMTNSRPTFCTFDVQCTLIIWFHNWLYIYNEITVYLLDIMD